MPVKATKFNRLSMDTQFIKALTAHHKKGDNTANKRLALLGGSSAVLALGKLFTSNPDDSQFKKSGQKLLFTALSSLGYKAHKKISQTNKLPALIKKNPVMTSALLLSGIFAANYLDNTIKNTHTVDQNEFNAFAHKYYTNKKNTPSTQQLEQAFNTLTGNKIKGLFLAEPHNRITTRDLNNQNHDLKQIA